MKKILLIALFINALQLQAQCWKQVSGSYYYKIGIKEDGTLWAWGKNEHGQFGNGTTQGSNKPVKIGTDNDWKLVDAGIYHAIALKNNGTLWAWGDNQVGQLGNGTLVNSMTPVQVGTDTDWVTINAGGYHNFATKPDGTLWAWGNNNDNQLGDGTKTHRRTPVKIGVDSWKSVSGGDYHSAGIKANGAFFAWGNGYSGQLGSGSNSSHYSIPIQISLENDFEKVYCGQEMTAVIKTDGTLWGAGDYFGWSLTQKGTGIFKKASLALSTIIAIKDDSTLWAMGANNGGQTGTGTTGDASDFVQVGTDSNWALPITGAYSSGGLKNNGELLCWGTNTNGELGTGNNTQSNLPVPIACPVASLENLVYPAISLYPNPTSDTIMFTNVENLNIQGIVIRDITGKIILNKTGSSTYIDVKHLPQGIYILNVLAKDGSLDFKFIKK